MNSGQRTDRGGMEARRVSINFNPLRVGLSAPSKVFEIWAGEFDYMIEHEHSGVFTLTMHPQVIGRGSCRQRGIR